MVVLESDNRLDDRAHIMRFDQVNVTAFWV